MADHSKKTILVVDDESRMVRFVKMNLDLEGYITLEANNGVQALEKVRDFNPDLVLLDVEMPGMDGFETLKRLREISDAAVIMLTVRADEEDRIKGLDLGADDYVTKPFSPRELSSRIRAVLRRFEERGRPDQQIITIDDHLQVDLQRRDVIVDGERLGLRPTEYRLLYHLIQNAGWVVPHETLLTKVWGHEYINDNHLLRLYITYLRKKIEPDPANPRYIFTERGLGYRFVDFKHPTRLRKRASSHSAPQPGPSGGWMWPSSISGALSKPQFSPWRRLPSPLR
jgi:DNA-binding response OmpR family regulator